SELSCFSLSLATHASVAELPVHKMRRCETCGTHNAQRHLVSFVDQQMPCKNHNSPANQGNHAPPLSVQFKTPTEASRREKNTSEHDSLTETFREEKSHPPKG